MAYCTNHDLLHVKNCFSLHVQKKTVQSATISRIAKDFPRGSDGKESTCNAGDLGSISEWGRSPGERNGQPTAVFLCGELHGQRSLVGYCP